jgi:hypothetical protein
MRRIFRTVVDLRDFGKDLCDFGKALASVAKVASMVDHVQTDTSRARGQRSDRAAVVPAQPQR